jgi:hypothetical protein
MTEFLTLLNFLDMKNGTDVNDLGRQTNLKRRKEVYNMAHEIIEHCNHYGIDMFKKHGYSNIEEIYERQRMLIRNLELAYPRLKGERTNE